MKSGSMYKTRRLFLTSLSQVAIFSAATGMCALCAPGAWAQQYPSKPIHMIVPYAAGGTVDIVGRVIGADISKRLGQAVIVENKTGAGGNLAASFVAKSDPDGYTLLTGSTGNSANGALYSKLNYDPDRDLVPIALVGTVATVLLAHPSLPANNVAELIALAKSKPDTLNFGSGGAGTTEHLAGAMFNAKAGTKMKHIPYRGGIPALTDVVAGRIELMFTNLAQATPYIKSKGGTLKVLGIASTERAKQLPDVPTFAEQGIPDFTVSVWWGIFGPANLPPAIVERLNQAINAGLASPEVAARLESTGATLLGGTAAQFATFFANESAKWRTVIRAAGIKAD